MRSRPAWPAIFIGRSGPFRICARKAEYGCIVTNPPYGERMGADDEIERLYRSFPIVLRRLPTWSFYILSARPDLEALVGQTADRRRKLYNGPLECTYYQFHGPRPPRDEIAGRVNDEPEGAPEIVDSTGGTPKAPAMGVASLNMRNKERIEPSSHALRRKLRDPPPRAGGPAFGGLLPASTRQAEEFANRLRNRARTSRRWPTKRGITCYRLVRAQTCPTCRWWSIATKTRCTSPSLPGRMSGRPPSMPTGSI